MGSENGERIGGPITGGGGGGLKWGSQNGGGPQMGVPKWGGVSKWGRKWGSHNGGGPQMGSQNGGGTQNVGSENGGGVSKWGEKWGSRNWGGGGSSQIGIPKMGGVPNGAGNGAPPRGSPTPPSLRTPPQTHPGPAAPGGAGGGRRAQAGGVETAAAARALEEGLRGQGSGVIGVMG